MEVINVPNTNAFRADAMRATLGNNAGSAANATVHRPVNEAAEHLQTLFYQFLESFESNLVGERSPTESHFYLYQLELMKTYDRTTLYVDYTHLLHHNTDLLRTIVDEYYRFEVYLCRAVQQLMRHRYPEYLMDDQRAFREFHVAFYNVPSVMTLRDVRTPQIGRLVAVTGTVTRTSEIRPELQFGTFSCLECQNRVHDVEQQFRYTEPLVCPNKACNNRFQWQLLVEQSRFADWQKARVQENATDIPAGSMPRSIDVIFRHDIVDRAKPGDKCVFVGSLIVVPDITQIQVSGDKIQVKSDNTQLNDGISKRATGALHDGIRGAKSMNGPRDLTYRLCFLANMVYSTTFRFSSESNDDDEEDKEQSKEAPQKTTSSSSTTFSPLLLDLFLGTNDDDLYHSNGSNDGPYASSSSSSTSLSLLKRQFTSAELNDIEWMRRDRHIYQRLSECMAPTIRGHDEIKKGLLLMLMGGLYKETPEGMHLRGDINVCVVGDPATAKSQFLKFVCQLLPRAVYASGKSSSAAGLTASVVKDEESGQFAIEAGALMLADHGVCCIDEFDKMDLADQVAIHEAMEQQTISIAKAGIRATLNARASILAAANPVGGRYNRKKSLRANLAMTPAILSRFDLFFVILDETDDQIDENMARHILQLHQFTDEAVTTAYSVDQVLRYLRFARAMAPRFTEESQRLLVELYQQLRQADADKRATSYRITVRQLESLIRLSEALARVHLAEEVQPAYVREAYRLLKKSLLHVENDQVELFTGGEEEEEKIGESVAGVNTTESDELPQPPPTNEKLVLSYEAYAEMTMAVVVMLRKASHTQSMKRSEVINAYLTELIQSDASVDHEEKLVQQHQLLTHVLQRLVRKEHVLIELRNPDNEEDPFLVVHPNYVLDDIDG